MAPQQQERHEAFLAAESGAPVRAEPARPNSGKGACLWAAVGFSALLLAGVAVAGVLVLSTGGAQSAQITPATTEDLLAADPDPAEILLRQLRQVKSEDTPQRLALHTSAGHIFRDQGRYAEAVKHYGKVLGLAKTTTEVVQAQQLLGLVEMHQGRLTDARNHLESAFVLIDQEHELSLTVLRTLADVRREMGSIEEALKLYELAWQMGLKRRDSDGLVLVAAEMAEAFARKGEVETALAWLRKANQQLDANKLERGSRGEASVIAKVDGYMASVHHARGDVTQARELYRKALRGQAATLRPNHPDILATRMSMARAQRDAGDIDSALRAIDAVAKTLRSGPNEGPDLSRALILKADLLREAKRHGEAEQEIKEALKLQQRVFGNQAHPEMAVAHSSFGSLLHDMGKAKQAHVEYKKALTLNLKTVGSRHPETASTYNSLGTLYEDIGDNKAAQEHFTKCLEIQLHTVGEHSPDVANTYNNLATILFRRGSQEEAADLLRKAIAVLDAAGVPKGNPDRAIYEENLEEVLNPAKNDEQTDPEEEQADPEEEQADPEEEQSEEELMEAEMAAAEQEYVDSLYDAPMQKLAF